MNLNPRQHEKGQTLIIFAVVMVVLVALTALVIDGGFAYTKRREAQNAADAGALAGANALCAGNDDQAIPQALDYAINRNGATDATADLGTKSITVTTTIPQATFLAGIFGSDEVTTHATASAGCYTPCEGIGVLPVAWACQPPAGGVISDTCAVQYGPSNLYVIMDSKKSGDDFFCQDPPNSGLPTGTLDCDIDNDGVDDLETGGNRSWLDLTGKAGAGDLRDWIRNGFPGALKEHTCSEAKRVWLIVYSRKLIAELALWSFFLSLIHIVRGNPTLCAQLMSIHKMKLFYPVVQARHISM
jgi:hypothetical protein